MDFHAVSALVVEDHADLAGLIAQTLRHIGLSPVRTARTAEDAFVLCESALPTLLVTDIHLPGASGLALIRELRATFADRAPRVIILSGRLPPGSARIDGVSATLAKPCSTGALREVVQRVLAEPVRVRS